jgi:HAD superfamily hydrolase (TIGR01509 family)
MDWTDKFDLFLFDFDGLLVDTEELHFKAYQMLCQGRGYKLPWDINRFFELAHADAFAVRKELQRLFSQMFEDASWDVLYAEKKKYYEALLGSGSLSLLPGVESLLKKLAEQSKKRCVVTNSTLRQVESIKSQIPVLQTIQHWFTRESYERPKPAPDGYLAALRELKADGDRVIGFEDSMRGYISLQEAGVSTSVLICQPSHPQLQTPAEGRLYVPSFTEVQKLFAN